MHLGLLYLAGLVAIFGCVISTVAVVLSGQKRLLHLLATIVFLGGSAYYIGITTESWYLSQYQTRLLAILMMMTLTGYILTDVLIHSYVRWFIRDLKAKLNLKKPVNGNGN